MTSKINGLRGMPDILPDEASKWQYVENSARRIFGKYGYSEIRTPVLEETALFKRTIGEETEIVQKQMYSFKDRGDREISLRPEGTAAIVRAYLEHALDMKMPSCRLFYMGPMFRSERPQAGRNRQFYQIGAEAIGSQSPYLDSELICLMMGLLGSSGLAGAELNINTLGCAKDKLAFENILRKVLGNDLSRLCGDCQKRYEKNILRIFDCKNEACKAVLRAAPKMIDHICDDCKAHFETVKKALRSVAVPYSVDPLLVRGLDYYSRTVFEVTHRNLGSQDAVCAGGRYNDLIEALGGQKTPACGFALGMERLILAAKDNITAQPEDVRLFAVLLGERAREEGFKIIAGLRNKGLSCQMDCDGRSLKSQMRLADRMRAKKVLILGDDEMQRGVAVLRDMETKLQSEISVGDIFKIDL